MASINIFYLFLNASFFIKLIISILVFFSVTSWAIIIQKTRMLGIALHELKTFENKFWSGIELSRLYQESQSRRDNIFGYEKIFHSGFKEFTYLYQINDYEPKIIIEGVSRAMRISMNRELEILEVYIPFLDNVGSISPYVGLLGTVFGIIHAFNMFSSIKQATIQIVAPGIAEALVTTAIGLFTAIPAVIAHNRLNQHMKKLEMNYDNFIEEFIAILYRQIFSNIKDNKEKTS